MNKEQIKKIIKEYKPHKGFHDLSTKPKTLTDKQYAIILDAQNYLAVMEEDKEYLIKNKPITYRQIQSFSATLQGIILEHWGSKIYRGD